MSIEISGEETPLGPPLMPDWSAVKMKYLMMATFALL